MATSCVAVRPLLKGVADRECDCRGRRRAPGATGGGPTSASRRKRSSCCLILVRNQPERRTARATARRALARCSMSPRRALRRSVTQLRKGLGDTSDGGRVIRTLHRVGYAFIGDAIITVRRPVAEAPVCRLIWRREAIDVSAGESVIRAAPWSLCGMRWERRGGWVLCLLGTGQTEKTFLNMLFAASFSEGALMAQVDDPGNSVCQARQAVEKRWAAVAGAPKTTAHRHSARSFPARRAV